MSDYFKVNDDEYVQLRNVRRIRIVSDKDRESLASLGKHVRADRFNTRIDEANGANFYASETIDEIAAQGVSLVEIDENIFIPLKNIGRMRNLTDKDRAKFGKNTGNALRAEFKSRIQTRAGTVLSTYDCPAIMQRMNRPYQPANSDPKAGNENGVQTSSQSEQGLEHARDAVMAQTSKGANQ